MNELPTAFEEQRRVETHTPLSPRHAQARCAPSMAGGASAGHRGHQSTRTRTPATRGGLKKRRLRPGVLMMVVA